ncbi:putative gustatory receptor 28b [Pogonomyrmex barbatus]|uniref:Gustatory receptor n=1 Tax=Pogonomyrmex barbatus TaxID=144034 RepID=A0A8N1S2Q0_9HYME|nr:putative gustatory receptor 28b [Pogonomyrmex barbatus]
MFCLLSKFRERAKYEWRKWKLFHATDFQSLMYPCFILCNILGIFPYKINGSTFENSKQRYILSTVIICVFCIYELIVLYMIDISKTIKYKSVPETLENNIFYILSGFSAIVTYVTSGPRMHLLQSIMKISSRLPPELYQKLSTIIHAKDIFGFLFLIAQVSLYYIMIDMDYLLESYFVLLVFQMDMLYVNCVCVLKACFKEINKNLTNLQELMVNDEPRLSRQTYHKQKNSFLLTEIKTLRDQHLMISETVQMLNKVFSLHLLATIILTFVQITFLLYYGIVHWKVEMILSNLNHQFYDIMLIISVIYYCIKIILIGWTCETGMDEAMKIGSTVHKVLNSITDEQIKNELQQFSLQILHRKNIFSTKGLIIDAMLLTAVSN